MKKRTIKHTDAPTLEETLFVFRRKLSEALRQESEDLHFPISHIDTLSYIAEKGDPSMKEIANHLKITPPSATAIIETMQKKKLVARITNGKDRRTVRIMLTPRAWKFFKSLHERKMTIFTTMLSRLKEADKKQFIRILTILIKE